MANLRSTNDVKKFALARAGELTDGTSSYDSDALEFIIEAHRNIIGGSNLFNLSTNEPWIWAKSRYPIILNLQPKQTGACSLTQNSESGTFSVGPTPSLKGWFLKIDGRDSVFQIAEHTAGATAFELDADYPDDTGASLNFRAFKLDYDLVPDQIIIDSENDKIDFEETASTELTSTLTHGTYSPSELATEIKTQMDTDGASVYTVSFASDTRKFTIVSDGAGGGGILTLLGSTGTNSHRHTLPNLGYTQEDKSAALTYTSDQPLHAIERLPEPLSVHRSNDEPKNKIFEIDPKLMSLEHQLHLIREEIPTRFATVRKKPDGTLVIRFNAYPAEITRVEIPWIPEPLDLKDNSTSEPLLPVNFRSILAYGAAHFIAEDRADDKATSFLAKAVAELQAMIQQVRKQHSGNNPNYGRLIPRRDSQRRISVVQEVE